MDSFSKIGEPSVCVNMHFAQVKIAKILDTLPFFGVYNMKNLKNISLPLATTPNFIKRQEKKACTVKRKVQGVR